MAAQTVLFSNYPTINPRPPRLYCDTNFLIRLLFYHDNNATNPTVITQKDRDCFNFYNQLQADGSELVTSVYGFSELVHFYFFSYSGGMYEIVLNYFKNRGIVLPPNVKKIHEKYKYFMRTYPADFNTAFLTISHRIAKVDQFLSQAKIRILYPLPSPHLTNISKHIVEYASVLMDSFPKLESNDALHISIADYLNITNIVSLDEAFKDVDGYTVYARS